MSTLSPELVLSKWVGESTPLRITVMEGDVIKHKVDGTLIAQEPKRLWFSVNSCSLAVSLSVEVDKDTLFEYSLPSAASPAVRDAARQMAEGALSIKIASLDSSVLFVVELKN